MSDLYKEQVQWDSFTPKSQIFKLVEKIKYAHSKWKDRESQQGKKKIEWTIFKAK